MIEMEAYELPRSACERLAEPGLKLVLHCITFSHYCERARWTLRLLGLPYEEVNYQPLVHIPAIIRLQREFKQGPGPPTASSKSPAATPCLAIYDSTGRPLCLLQDSALICRYAVLRATTLGLPYASHLYGPGLRLAAGSTQPSTQTAAGPASAQPGSHTPTNSSPAAPPDSCSRPGCDAGCSPAGDSSMDPGSGVAAADAAAAADRVAVVDGSAKVVQLEHRLGGTLGIEARRLVYHHLLPVPSVGGALFINNSTSKLMARVVYWICRLLLPKLLRINASTAARGRDRLLAEFDYLDSLLQQQQQQQQQTGPGTELHKPAIDGTAETGAAGGDSNASLPPTGTLAAEHPATSGANGGSNLPSRLPYYLFGPDLSIADITLACLAAPVLFIPNELANTWLPPINTLPPAFRSLVQELRQRPTGKFVLDMWHTHGPQADRAAVGSAGAGSSAGGAS